MNPSLTRLLLAQMLQQIRHGKLHTEAQHQRHLVRQHHRAQRVHCHQIVAPVNRLSHRALHHSNDRRMHQICAVRDPTQRSKYRMAQQVLGKPWAFQADKSDSDRRQQKPVPNTQVVLYSQPIPKANAVIIAATYKPQTFFNAAA